MTHTHEQAARALGMKISEILEVRPAATGSVITTHDGVQNLLTDEGAVVPLAPGALVAEHGPELEMPDADKQAVSVEATKELAGQPPAEGETPGSDATVEAVMQWVGEDTDRARQALENEQHRDKPRVTLVAALEKLAESGVEQ